MISTKGSGVADVDAGMSAGAGVDVDAGLVLPGEEAVGLMEFCGVGARDREEMLAARPDAVREPEWWAVTAALAESVVREMEMAVPSTGFEAWPAVPMESSAVGLFAGAWALLACVPRLVEVHARRGVPEAVTRATVSALGGVMSTHRQIFGRAGVGLIPLWSPPLRFRGTDFEIGRHAFTRAQLGIGDGVSGHVLMMHIPPTGRLDAQASEESVAQATRLFERCYPEEPVAAFVCHSWLLDPDLADYLSADSNIIRFQRRFDLLPQLPMKDPSEGDREMMRLGLHLSVPDDGPLTEDDLDRVPQETSLQRAFVSHLRAGEHWQLRTGVLRKPS
ncbi:acyltransferase domain-containing protein [Kribbella ginsengisoli]|uniref:acyltransferase domain-containing protein n=1 Tax=Kribbella ginsengisoli TaxID=363865 RepID=UPI0031E36CBF